MTPRTHVFDDTAFGGAPGSGEGGGREIFRRAGLRLVGSVACPQQHDVGVDRRQERHRGARVPESRGKLLQRQQPHVLAGAAVDNQLSCHHSCLHQCTVRMNNFSCTSKVREAASVRAHAHMRMHLSPPLSVSLCVCLSLSPALFACVCVKREVLQPHVFTGAAVDNQLGCHHRCLHQHGVRLNKA